MTWEHRWGLPECLGDLFVASGPIYILQMSLRCRPGGFSTRLPKDWRLGHLVNWCLLPCWLCGGWGSALWDSLPYLCGTHLHSSCISQGYDLHRQYVQYLFQRLYISLGLRLWMCDDRERKPGTCGMISLPRSEPNYTIPTTSHHDFASR